MPHQRDQHFWQGEAHAPVALALDHTDGAGFGDGEIGPRDCNFRVKKFFAQICARCIREHRGFVGKFALAELRFEESLYFGAVAMNGRHQDMAWRVMRQLHDHVGQIGLDGIDAGGTHCGIEIDLIRRHGLDFDHPLGLVPTGDIDDDLARFFRHREPNAPHRRRR